jgi:hypothetical protein
MQWISPIYQLRTAFEISIRKITFGTEYMKQTNLFYHSFLRFQGYIIGKKNICGEMGHIIGKKVFKKEQIEKVIYLQYFCNYDILPIAFRTDNDPDELIEVYLT